QGPPQQGDALRHAERPEAVLRLAGRAARVQVPDFILRCRLFQPVDQGDEDRQGPSGPACADPGADPTRHPNDAGQHRDRAPRSSPLIALTILTGARDGAIASLKLKHIDIDQGRVDQDARQVKTKFSKSFATWFFPVGEDIRRIVVDWVTYLRQG